MGRQAAGCQCKNGPALPRLVAAAPGGMGPRWPEVELATSMIEKEPMCSEPLCAQPVRLVDV